MKSHQAGGIVSFVIVGVVLTGLLLGGLYLSKSQGRTARENTPAPQVATQDEATNEGQQGAATEQREGSGNASPQSPTQNPQSQTTPPATSGTSTTNQSRVANTGPSDDIPATGPVETFASVVALSGLTFAGYRYAHARRVRRTSALSS